MKIPVYVWFFLSSDGVKKYETLQYDDGSLSCGCPGWTRRVWPGGERSFKHTRLVTIGDYSESYSHAPLTGTAKGDYVERVESIYPVKKPKPKPAPALTPETFARKFNL